MTIEEHYSVDIHRPKQNSPERLGLNCFAIKKHMEEMTDSPSFGIVRDTRKACAASDSAWRVIRKLKLSLLTIGCLSRGH